MTSRWVLVVEDDLDTRQMLREILELEGYLVREAADGAQALDVLRTERGGHDCLAVVLDLMLPSVDGLEVLAALARDSELSRLPVVAVSASAPKRALEVDAFFHKPFSLDAFLARLGALLDRRAAAATPPLGAGGPEA
ncbi:MAG TPA: response regulator [Myxococcales bacterium]|jgi:DNA-binding response OmpR family regulator